MRVPLVVVRWLPTAVEQRVQFCADGVRGEFLSQSLAKGLGLSLATRPLPLELGWSQLLQKPPGCMGRVNIRLKLTFSETEERGHGNWYILDRIQY